jgi:beta-exotoxin I transport system permease protein
VRAVAALVRHSLWRWRALLVAMTIFLVVFQFFMIFGARSLEQAGTFSQLETLMPEFIRQLTNVAMASFRGFVLFGYSHPLVQLFLMAMAIGLGTEPAGEIEMRFVDLTMARPVPRWAPIVRTAIVIAVATGGAILSMLAATSIGLRLLAPPGRAPDARVIVSLAVNLGFLILAWGGVSLALAVSARRRATAIAASGFLAFAAFVVDFVSRFWRAVAPIARLSPFHYFNPFAMMGGEPLAVSNIGVLAAIFVAGIAAAQIIYARRDL